MSSPPSGNPPVPHPGPKPNEPPQPCAEAPLPTTIEDTLADALHRLDDSDRNRIRLVEAEQEARKEQGGQRK